MAVIFRGLSPHDLSAVDSGVARPLDGNVEMTLYVLDDWHSPTSHAIRAPMQPAMARALANALMAAAAQAEAKT